MFLNKSINGVKCGKCQKLIAKKFQMLIFLHCTIKVVSFFFDKIKVVS